MATSPHIDAATGRWGFVIGLARGIEAAARRRVGRERPTVIVAGKSKLSDARSPLVVSVTDEQAHKVLEFVSRDS